VPITESAISRGILQEATVLIPLLLHGRCAEQFCRGFIVDKALCSAGFLVLACCALGAFLLLWIAMPETLEPNAGNPRGLASVTPPTR